MWRWAEANNCDRLRGGGGVRVDDPLPGTRVILIELRLDGAVLFIAKDREAHVHRVEEGLGGFGGKWGSWEAIGG